MRERRKPWFVLAAVALVFIIGCAGKAPESFISFTTNLTQKDQVGREIPILPGAYSGEPYTWNIIPLGGTPPYNCTLTPGSSLPGTLQFVGCMITGVAPAVSSDTFFPFRFTITDANGRVGGPFELSLPVRLRPPILKVPARLPEAVIGAQYEHVFCDPPSERELDCGGRPPSKNPSGGVPPYSFSASGLPIGLSLGFNGVLKGAVREGYRPDEYEIEVCVKDSRLFLSCEKTILPVVERAIQFMAPERLPAATIGGLYKYEFCDPTTGGIFDCGFAPIEVGKVGNPSGGTPPYIFSASGLLAGLSMKSKGLLTGTVREGTPLGPRAVRICVTDFAGLGTCVDTILEIVAFPGITISRLPTATIGTWYSFDFSSYVSGGKPPYKFTVRVSLPRGLRLEPTGKLVGVIEPGFRPLGDMEILICVLDANEYSSCADIILPIADVPTAPPPPPAPTRCTSPYEGVWSGVLTTHQTGTVDLTLTLTCVSVFEGQHTLEITQMRSSYGDLGCSDGCKPVEAPSFGKFVIFYPDGSVSIAYSTAGGLKFPNGAWIQFWQAQLGVGGTQFGRERGFGAWHIFGVAREAAGPSYRFTKQ